MKTKTQGGPLLALATLSAGLMFTLASCSPAPPSPAPTPASGAAGTPAQAAPAARPAHGKDPSVIGGPGPAAPDRFHPDNQPGPDGQLPDAPAPRKGGRVVVHLSNLPKNMNYMIENSAVTHRMLYQTHEFLVQRDWESWEHFSPLASALVQEDTLLLKPDAASKYEHTTVRELDPDKKPVLFGAVTEEGDHYLVTPKSAGSPLSAPVSVARDDVDSIEPSTVFTFTLRDGIKWQDGHPLDTADIDFSYRSYLNPAVDCDNIRFVFQKFSGNQVIDAQTIRFYYTKRYFLALDAFTNLTILPSHLYNLSDPDNPRHVKGKKVTDADQGKFINEHPGNTMWVGLGPYKVTDWNNQYVEAQRWDGYFDSANGGNVDTIRWRYISNDDAAMQAVVNGELDYFDRVSTDDYFGELTQKPEFTNARYKGYFYTPRMGYTVWNMRRPLFADKNVRLALGMAFDWDEYIRTKYHGLGVRVTGVTFYLSPDYDHAIEPIPFDLVKAGELLAEAGWYDRDGDGIVDKDGKPLEFEFLMPTGNKASESFGLLLQENLGKIGVKMNIVTREWATFLERIMEADYDCANLAWIMEVESDPEQLWHSSLAGKRSSNHAGVADPRVDELIAKVQVELDAGKRHELRYELQRVLYDLQPYMFGTMVPTKFAMARRVRGFQQFGIDPGYSIRRWYIIEDQK